MAKRLIRKRFILSFILVAILGLFFLSIPLRVKVAGWALHTILNRMLHTPVEWKELHLELLPPQLQFKDISIPPFLTVETLSISPTFPRLWGSDIFISGLTVNLNVKPSGGEPGVSAHLPFVYFDRLTLVKSRIILEDAQVPLDGEFDSLTLFTWGDRGLLWSRRCVLKLMTYTPVEFGARIGFHRDRDTLHLDHVLLEGSEISLRGKGTFSTDPMALDLHYDLRASITPWMKRFRVPVDVEGQGRMQGDFKYRGRRLEIIGEGEFTEARILDSPAGELKAGVHVDIGPQGRKVNASVTGARAKARAEVDIAGTVTTRTELTVLKAPVSEILKFFHVPAPDYGKPVSGRGEFNFIEDRVGEATGGVDLASADGAFTFAGRIEGLGMKDVRLALHEPDLRLEGSGSFPFNTQDPVDLQGTVARSELPAVQKFLSPYLPALDPAQGWVEGRVTITRNFAKPLLEVQAGVGDVRYSGLPWGAGTAALHLDGSDFVLDSVRLAQGKGRLEASGNLTDGFGFSYIAWPWTLPIGMELSGTGRMLFAPRFLIQGRVTSAIIPAVPVPMDALTAGFTYDGTVLALDDVEARAGGGRLTGAGRYEADFRFDGAADHFPVFEGTTATGTWSIVYKGAQSEAAADLVLDGSEPALFPARMKARLSEGHMSLEASTPSCGSLTASGTLGEGPSVALTGRVEAVQTPMFPLKIEPPLSADFSISGDLMDPRRWSGGLTLPPFSFAVSGVPFSVPKGVKAELKEGWLRVPPTDISYDYAIIEVQGGMELKKNLPLEAKVTAYFGDELVHSLVPELEYSGEATMEVSLRKPAKALEMDGTLDINGTLLKILPINMPLEKPRGTVRFSGNRITLERFTASTGEGTVEAHGEAFTVGAGLYTVDLKIEGKAITLNYPQGMRMVLDGGAELVITHDTSLLSGRVVLVRGTYTKDLNLLSEITRAFAPSTGLPSYSNLPDIRLNLDIRIPGTLLVKNQMMDLIVSGRLQVAGTLPKPVVLGQVETLAEGRIYFNGVQYTIVRAQAQLSNPKKLDPYLDVEAEATVKSYLIHLKLFGPLSRLTPQFTSEPYLTESDIISLLASGKIASQQQGAFLSGATLLLSQQLSQQISQNTSAIFGLDRIRIEPVMGEGTISGARLTVTKQVSPACSISYTYNPSINEKDIISVECTVTGSAFLNLLQEEDGSYSIQLLRRKRF